MIFATKGYLTGGIYRSTAEEWAALYRLEDARRRWRADRARHQYANTLSFGVEPYVVTYRHAFPNPAHVAWRVEQEARRREWAEENYARRLRRQGESQKRREERAALWLEMGWKDSAIRARWVVSRLLAGDTQAAIARKAKLGRSRVSQIIAGERRRRWRDIMKRRGPVGRVFEPDNFYPRDVWITYTIEDDPNEMRDRA